MAESPAERGLIWAGTDDGLVHVSTDDGATWKDVTPKDLPAWATVAVIEASRFDAGTAKREFSAVDLHDLAESCVEKVEPLAAEKKIEITSDHSRIYG